MRNTVEDPDKPVEDPNKPVEKPSEGEKPSKTPANATVFDGTTKSFDFSDTSKTLTEINAATDFLALDKIKTGDNNELEIDLSGLELTGNSTVKEALQAIETAAKKTVDDWNAANKDADYTYEYVGLSTTSDESGKISLQANESGLNILINKVPKETEEPEASSGITSSGTINKGLLNVTDNNNGATAQLANTVVDFSNVGAWKDGSKITIGDTTYTVAMGGDSKFKNAANVIDLTDSDTFKTDTELKQAAAQRLTVAAKDNKIFTVGHDGQGNTTLQQRSEVKDSTDMTTKEKVASYLGVSTANADSLENAKAGKGLTLQIGDTADSYNKLTVSIKDMHTASLGLDNVSISDQDSAAAAIEKIKAAINTVSDVRGTLGATQNRLDHTINNLSVMTENIQDAESTIRDTDVAEEMMAYTKNNILIQSAQAMLAQANQVPQGVLQLLG